MIRIFFPSRIKQLGLLCLLWASTVLANEIGSVLFTVGKVSVERGGQTLALKKGDVLQAGDLVLTGPKGRAQLKMVDKSRVALRPGTRYKVEALVPPTEPSGGVTTTNTEETAIINLLQGGFRTITGTVGKEKKDTYKVRTPVATIGIRGTEYLAQLCIRETADPCASACFIPPDGHVDPGEQQWELYVGVLSGGVTLTNNADSLIVLPGEYGCVPSVGQSPLLLSRPPSVLDGLRGVQRRNVQDDDGDGVSRSRRRNIGGSQEDTADATDQQETTSAAEDGDTETNKSDPNQAAQTQTAQTQNNRRLTPPRDNAFNNPPPQNDVVPGETNQPRRPPPANITNGPTTPVTFATGPLGERRAYSAANQPPSMQIEQNSQQQLIQFTAPYPGGSATYALGSNTVQGDGFDPVTQLRWGRWSGGTANITLDSNEPANQDLTNQSLHWVIGPEVEGSAVLPQSGTASYSIVGNTDPTDNAGNIGVLGDANLTADFTNGVVNSDVTLSIGQDLWQANGSGTIEANSTLFNGDYTNVQINNNTGGEGEFSGFFLNEDASGAGLTYSLSDGDSNTVSGSAAFEQNGATTP